MIVITGTHKSLRFPQNKFTFKQQMTILIETYLYKHIIIIFYSCNKLVITKISFILRLHLKTNLKNKITIYFCFQFTKKKDI